MISSNPNTQFFSISTLSVKFNSLIIATFLILRVKSSRSAALSSATFWSVNESIRILAAALQLVLVQSLVVGGVEAFFVVVEIAGEIRAEMDLRPGQIHDVLDQFLLALAQIVLARTLSSCAKLIPNSKWYSEDNFIK